MELEQFAAKCGIRLEPFQKRIAKAVAGPEREFVALMPRGQSKTSLSALLALHHLVTVEDAAVYCAAAALHQARILFEYAERYARELEHPNLVKRHLELRWCPDPDDPRTCTRHLRALPAEAPKLHGLTFSLAVLDELQAQRDDGVYTALASGLQKRPGAKLIVISTAAQGADSPLGKLRARALAQPRVTRRGALTDARGPELRMLEWSVSESDDVDDPKGSRRRIPHRGSAWSSSERPGRACRTSLTGATWPTSGPSGRDTGCLQLPGNAASVRRTSRTASRS
jgi:phage terminase large subunit-like protein